MTPPPTSSILWSLREYRLINRPDMTRMICAWQASSAISAVPKVSPMTQYNPGM